MDSLVLTTLPFLNNLKEYGLKESDLKMEKIYVGSPKF